MHVVNVGVVVVLHYGGLLRLGGLLLRGSFSLGFCSSFGLCLVLSVSYGWFYRRLIIFFEDLWYLAQRTCSPQWAYSAKQYGSSSSARSHLCPSGVFLFRLLVCLGRLSVSIVHTFSKVVAAFSCVVLKDGFFVHLSAVLKDSVFFHGYKVFRLFCDAKIMSGSR